MNDKEFEELLAITAKEIKEIEPNRMPYQYICIISLFFTFMFLVVKVMLRIARALEYNNRPQ
jgi:hypothetical protein